MPVTRCTRRGQNCRTGFTLVELLVVIAIIGILAGLLLPAIQMVRRRATNTAIAMDIKNLDSALAAYKLKYGDYPPDFSNKDIVRRHILKAWPNIDSMEMQAVWALFWIAPANNADHRSRVDPAEALVFFLGGFSTDPRRPFTGRGGPFRVLPGPTFTINTDRNTGVFEFNEGRLTQDSIVISGTTVLMSTDEVSLHNRPVIEADSFPVYLVKGRQHPFVYFDSRTYGGTVAPPPVVLPPVYPPRAYSGTTSINGFAMAHLSDRRRNPDPIHPLPFEWVNKKTYQIISAGLDADFGGIPGAAFPRRFPSGNNYRSPGNGDDDNITNFSEGNVLKDMKP